MRQWSSSPPTDEQQHQEYKKLCIKGDIDKNQGESLVTTILEAEQLNLGRTLNLFPGGFTAHISINFKVSDYKSCTKGIILYDVICIYTLYGNIPLVLWNKLRFDDPIRTTDVRWEMLVRVVKGKVMGES
uniref:Uncharacterized protein n=1 Tax=Magallana gigas TaxID=29159 RepID=K1QPJ2_MAGGI